MKPFRNRLSFAVGLVSTALTILHAPADLVSYWSMDETEGDTAKDSVGSNDAVFQGDPTVSLEWTAGRIGGAAKLIDSGGEDYFRIETIEAFIDSKAITIAAWVDLEPQVASAYNGIFMTRTINDRENNSWGLASQDRNLDSRVDGPGLRSPDGSFVPDGGWYHVAMVWDGSEGSNRNYINGELAAENLTAFLGTIEGTSGPWYIGYDDCCGGRRELDGLIDEVAVWNEALDASKIALLAKGARPDQLQSLDLDDDGLPNDYEEGLGFLDPNNPADAAMDQDNDGLSNLLEFLTDTDPEVADTDGDGLTDGAEVNIHGSNPKVTDTDADGLDDGLEVNTHMTDPRFADTDGDRISDSDELADGTNPLDPLSPIPPAPPEPGLVALWRFDETAGGIAKDVVNGRDGIWQDGEANNLEWTTGVIGGAASLTDAGGNDYFQIDDFPELIGAKAISISVWVNPNAQGGYNGIFMTRTFNGRTNNSWGVAYEADGRLDTRVDGPGIDSEDGAIAPDEDTGWYHVVLVWNGEEGTHAQYVNGVQSNKTEGSLSEAILGPISGPWYIGYDDCCGGGRDFDGLIDDLSVWTLVLSEEDVAEMYQNGLAGNGVAPGARFRITDVQRQAVDEVSLTWTSQPGQFFGVRSSTTLEPNSWTVVAADLAAGDGEVTSAVVPATESTAFYQVLRVPPPAVLSEDFEGGAPGWTVVTNGIAAGTTWELGTPSVVGPPAANSGSSVYGTDLDAPYESNLIGEGNRGIALRSPVIDLAGDTLVTLEFAYFLDLAADEQGGGRINILDETGATIESLETLLILGEVPMGEWVTLGPVRLSQAITGAGKIIVEFEFISAESASARGGGLYIDDVIVK